MKKKILNIDLKDIDLSPSQIIYFMITNSIIIFEIIVMILCLIIHKKTGFYPGYMNDIFTALKGGEFYEENSIWGSAEFESIGGLIFRALIVFNLLLSFKISKDEYTILYTVCAFLLMCIHSFIRPVLMWLISLRVFAFIIIIPLIIIIASFVYVYKNPSNSTPSQKISGHRESDRVYGSPSFSSYEYEKRKQEDDKKRKNKEIQTRIDILEKAIKDRNYNLAHGKAFAEAKAVESANRRDREKIADLKKQLK